MEKITIIGNIGQDATRKSSNGKDFCSFSVAVNHKYKDKDGVQVEKATWYNCVKNLTEVDQYLIKGEQVYIEGKPRYSIYRDKNNESKIDISISVRDVQLLGGQKKEESPKESKLTIVPEPNGNDDDLPF